VDFDVSDVEPMVVPRRRRTTTVIPIANHELIELAPLPRARSAAGTQPPPRAETNGDAVPVPIRED